MQATRTGVRSTTLALLGMAAIFAAMSGRAGFVNWVAVGNVAFLAACALLLIVVALAFLAVPLGLVLFALKKVVDLVVGPRRGPMNQPPPAP